MLYEFTTMFDINECSKNTFLCSSSENNIGMFKYKEYMLFLFLK